MIEKNSLENEMTLLNKEKGSIEMALENLTQQKLQLEEAMKINEQNDERRT